MPPDKKKKAEAASPQKLVPPEDRAGPSPAFASEDYNQVARAAKLRALMLTKASFFVLPTFIMAQENSDQKSKISYGSTMSGQLFDKERGLASCEWNWSVTAKSGRKKSLCVEASYRLIYSELTDCNEAAIFRFMRRVGRFTTYPYFRTHVSHVSWESNANLPILPVIAT